jgi:hypothetical protein
MAASCSNLNRSRILESKDDGTSFERETPQHGDPIRGLEIRHQLPYVIGRPILQNLAKHNNVAFSNDLSDVGQSPWTDI